VGSDLREAIVADEAVGTASTEPPDLDPGLLRTLLDVTLDAVVLSEADPVLEPDGPRIVWVNRAFERQTGWTSSEVVGRTPRVLHGPGTDREVLDQVRKRLAAWEDVDVELLTYTRDGRPFWVHLLMTPLAGRDGHVTHWVSVQRDVTERREAELARQRQDEFVSGVLSSMVAQTAVLDRDGVVVSANAAWERFWELNGGRGEVGPGTDYLAACDRASSSCGEGHLAAQGIRAVLEGRAPRFGLDYECSSPTAEAWYHCEVVPLRGPDGHLLPHGGCVVSHEDITERVLAQRRLVSRVERDELTGCATRERLTRVLDERHLLGELTTLLVCDLDGFKDVNDGLGHDSGDELLREVGARLRDVAGGDLVCRLGGDEFAVACAGDVAAAQQLAARLHARLREPIHVARTEVVLTASIGLAAHGPDVVTVLAQADAAMYRAKALGGSRTEVFSADLHSAAGRRLEVVSGLSRALAGDPAGGTLVLHCQPVVDMRSGRVESWEALVRWQHDGELVLPGDFLPLVTGTEQAVEVDLWVLETTCRALAARTGPREPVSVNADARTLADTRYLRAVEDLLHRYGLTGAALGVEVTEEVAAAEDVAGVLGELRRLGVRVSLDDFGTGWSSLTNLVRLPVDTLKVDRLFVERLATSQGQAVISAVVSMAGALGLRVVAEGVETPQQRDQVLALGGTYGQGFLYSRPQPWT
jgi:diguanylate cyclase (GGDEF)-like protein/PAS domain S-box-containing protein